MKKLEVITKGRSIQAFTSFQKLVKKRPTNASVHHQMGDVLHESDGFAFHITSETFFWQAYTGINIQHGGRDGNFF